MPRKRSYVGNALLLAEQRTEPLTPQHPGDVCATCQFGTVDLVDEYPDTYLVCSTCGKEYDYEEDEDDE